MPSLQRTQSKYVDITLCASNQLRQLPDGRETLPNPQMRQSGSGYERGIFLMSCFEKRYTVWMTCHEKIPYTNNEYCTWGSDSYQLTNSKIYSNAEKGWERIMVYHNCSEFNIVRYFMFCYNCQNNFSCPQRIVFLIKIIAFIGSLFRFSQISLIAKPTVIL